MLGGKKGRVVLKRHVWKVAAACAVTLLLLLHQLHRGVPTPAGLATPAFSRRTERYCNYRNDGAPVMGDEGMFGEKYPSATLVGLTIAIRHGDRSAVHALPGTLSVPRYKCSAAPDWPERLHLVSEKARSPITRPTSPEVGPDDICAKGQLTEAGSRQLSRLGSYIYAAYSERLDLTRFYARSTDYRRTILSAAAFLNTLSARDGSRQNLALHVFEREEDEVMHGVGLRSSSAGANAHNLTSGEKIIAGGCARAVHLASRQVADLRKPAHLKQQLAALFGSAAAEMPITDLGDALHAGACHGHPLPCGNGGCLTAATAAEILRAADEFYCERYSGDAGGRESARMAMYPFLLYILDGLQAMADRRTNATTRLFFGHDSIVAPLLSALGAFDCRWPPYASRVVFELWELREVMMVRLLYNGLPVTHKVYGCSGQDPCPLARFRRVVHGLIKPHTTLEGACTNEEG
ncbi:hypothetical protein DIPPA_22729 [Diplonema papillatum]|nr:hypothetical protein DIPPA_22729 [Diplonema papillatum]